MHTRQRNVETVYELSPMQRGMLFHTLYSPDSGVYVVQSSADLHGSLDVEAFERAWRFVVERHEVLRASYHWRGLEKPVQVVHRRVELEIERVSWHGLEAAEREERWRGHLAADRQRGFELEKAPLMRLVLFHFGDEEHRFLWTSHHLYLDGWSNGLVFKEVFESYRGFLEGKSPRLERARPFRHYISWLQKKDSSVAERFWRELLAGFDAPTSMSRREGRGVEDQEQEDRKWDLELSAELGEKLVALARRQRLTLNTLIQGAWSRLLSTYTGADDVVFGATTSGRPAELRGVETMVGLFINTLPVRVDVSPSKKVFAWLTRLQARQAAIREHEYHPLEQVQKNSELAAGVPLFDHILVFENFPVDADLAGALPGLAIGALQRTESTNYPLTVAVFPHRGIVFRILWDGRHFDEVTIRRVGSHLVRLLEALSVAPADRRLHELPLLSAAEEHQLRLEANDLPGFGAAPRLLPELLSTGARANPGGTALVQIGDPAVERTYADLEARARALAERMRRWGVGPEVVVGIAVERPFDVVEGMWAIFEAGGVHLPLDTSFPAERLVFMLRDAGARVLLSRGEIGDQLGDLLDRPEDPFQLRLERWEAGEGPGGAELEEERPGTEISQPAPRPENTAYLIYTSGSTGVPKGVAVTHGQVFPLLRFSLPYFELGPRTRVLQNLSYSFDFGLFELVTTLACGGTLFFPQPERRHEPAHLAELIAEHELDTVHATPTFFRRIAAVNRPLPSLEIVHLGGEAVSRGLVREIAAVVGEHCRIYNGYGPTEAAVNTAIFRVDAGRARVGRDRVGRDDGENLPIGRTTSRNQLYVLDHHGRLAPIGVAGELFVGGAGVARGYLGRPGLTAERFLPDPWSAGERLYRTGDRVRVHGDGQVEFLGRADHQVKLRGFRLELGEIEAVLTSRPGVREAVVVLQDTDRAPGEDRGLVAYVTASAEAPLDLAELRRDLRRDLPAPMVPAAFVVLESFPRTPSGKLDRRTLPAPETLAETSAEAPPRGPHEEILAEIFAEVLGREKVGIHDDFFALGGHSLRATQLVSRVREALAIPLPLRDLFDAPTVSELAAVVARRRETSDGARPPLCKAERKAPLPLSFAQERLWLLQKLDPQSAAYHVPIVVRFSGALDAAALGRALSEVVRRHEALRTSFQDDEGGTGRQIVEAWRPVTPSRVDLLGIAGPSAREGQVWRLAAEISGRPFDLDQAPLLRAVLVRTGEAEHVAILVLHHIVSDGWSGHVLLRDLSLFYRAAAEPDARHGLAALPRLPVQYADFAIWQRSWLRGETLEAHLAYWRAQLAAVSTLDLPTDRPRPPVTRFTGAHHRFALPPALIERARALGRSSGTTLFMIFLAVFQALCSRLSGQLDVVVGTPVAGRQDRRIENLIGFFVNVLVLRTDFSGRPTLREILLRVREVCLEAYAHQDVPFEKLVEELQPERDLARSPLFQVAFALHNAAAAPLDPGLEMEPIPFDGDSAKFDLTLDLYERREGLAGRFEYRTDLFDATTVARLEKQLGRLLEAALAAPERPLEELALLSREQVFQVAAEWNDTAARPPEASAIHRLFELQATRRPAAVAAIFEGTEISYGELDRRSRELAAHFQAQNIPLGTRVGVSMKRSLELLVVLLGTLRAGLTYVPLETDWPAERKALILGSLEVPCLLSSGSELRAAFDLQWRLPSLREVILLDVTTPEPPPEPFDVDAARALWDHVAERAVDEITAGGFVSSYTGEPMSRAEIEEYRDRVVGLAEPRLGPETRVLEIGCGSGLVLFELARRAGRVVGVDPSPMTQERNRRRLARLSLENVELFTAFAHELGPDSAADVVLEKESFDLVVLASTVQFFPGPAYLRAALASVLELLAPGGTVLVADVLDARRREEFRRSLEEYRAGHGGGGRVRSRLDELYLDEDVFNDLLADLPGFARCEIRHRDSGFENELGWRYDVLLHKACRPGAAEAPAALAPRQKYLHTRWHLRSREEVQLRDVPPEAIAYVIFTSGSTGTPKGVVVQHRPVLGLIEWVNSTFEVGPGDRLLFVTSPCFDLSVYDVFGTLAAGGSVRIASAEELADPARLARVLCEDGITFWDSAPAALQQLSPFFPPAGGETLRLVFSSGDWIPVSLPNEVRTVFPRARPIALGGATEATVWSNFFPIGEVDPGWPSIPYGRPIDNATYRVLEDRLQTQPIGVPGDLFIGGDCLAVGYAGAPAATAEKFLPDPFTGRGARLYRTGDRARFLADGNIEFLGRRDHQVKIRGFRIELGEIEAALITHPAVRAAVAVAWTSAAAATPAAGVDRRLVAYWVAAEGERTDAEQLLELLRCKLPEAMLPAALVELEAIPLTANGKVDRAALPDPQWAGGGDGEAMKTPETPTEEALLEAFQDVLGVARISIEASFFDLGGHSLLATRVMARTRRLFDVELPMRTLFESPSVAALAARIDAARGTSSSSLPALRPRSRDASPPPLSFAQERLWFLDALLPQSALYNMPVTLELRGQLDPGALARSFAALVDRHEVLRATFEDEGGVPRQRIAPRQEASFSTIDLRRLPRPARAAAEEYLVKAESGRPFDLERGPLWRARLIRTDPERHVLMVILHHIVGDGASFEVLRRELALAYRAFATGAEPALPPLPIQYADWAAWQRRWLRGQALEELLAWWKQHLAGLPESLDLPYDRRPRTAAAPRLTTVSFHVPAAVTRGLSALARDFEATLSMTLMTAFQVLLGRYTGSLDFAVGLAVANRRRVETEGLIGFFVNTLVQRADLSGSPAFRQALARTRHESLEIEARQELPFERLVEAQAPDRSLARNPLVQVMFSFQSLSREPLEIEGLRIEPRSRGADPGASKFDLTLAIDQAEQGLQGAFELDPTLFEATTIKRLARHWRNLLAAAVADPERGIFELPLLDPAQRHQLTREWSPSSVARGESGAAARGTLELVEARAADSPRSVALVHGSRSLSYGELDARANGLATRLLEAGVGPEVFVGVALERSAEWLVALLAVLKAGGAHVPLDPEYPAQRLKDMLADSAASVLLTRERWKEIFAASPVRRIYLDAEPIAPRPTAPPRRTWPRQSAYMIYTSGSTGRPKGVAVSHQALDRLVAWHRRAYATTAEDRATHLASVAFDASVWEIWPHLASGACLFVPPPEIRLDPPRLAGWMREQGVTVSFLPTPLAEALLKAETVEIPTLRALLTGGDRLHPVPTHGLRVVNHYGPTEATVVASAGSVSRDASSTPTLGRPLPHASIHLLDRRLRRVPPGVGGELCIGGTALARGYWKRFARTAESFVPDPLGTGVGQRLYRTGDLCRWLADGRLDFLGRIDQQVKIHGRRVELEEIESWLARQEEVEQAAVALREVDGETVSRLVAYVVPRSAGSRATAELDTEDLRERMIGQLPSFMVPTSFVALEALPLTPNGKLDRRALPAPTRAREERAGATPTPLEREVAALYEEILGGEVSPTDDFFTLGGHSLLATRLAARLRDVFGVEVPIRRLFERSTVRGLAAAIENLVDATGRALASVPLERRERGPGDHFSPLSHAQERLWFLSRYDPLSAAYNMPFAARWLGRLEISALAGALTLLVRRHEILRTTFVERDGQPMQRIAAAVATPFSVIDLRALPTAPRQRARRRLVARQARRPFDLERGPLWRSALVRLDGNELDGNEHLLLLTLHHAISDGVSLGIFVRDLASLYGALLDDAAEPLASLPELPVQYADYARWQRHWLSSPLPEATSETGPGTTILEAQLEYWRGRLAALPDRLELPTDRPRPASRGHRGAAVAHLLPPLLHRRLRELSRSAGTTLFMTLLAAFEVLLARLAGTEDLAVGTPVAGRRHSQVEGLVGCFLNHLVLRGDLSGAPSFRELLERVRQDAVGAYTHQDVPFEKLLEALRPERDLSRTPFFQVFFNMLEPEAGAAHFPGAVLEPVAGGLVSSPFDLTLYLTPRGRGEESSLELELVYDVELFDRERMVEFLQQYELLLAQIVERPDERVHVYSLRTPAAKAFLPDPRQPLDRTWRGAVHELFARRAAHDPTRLAVIDPTGSWTYGELLDASRRLAADLVAAGVERGDVVAVWAHRCAALAVAVLGVLEAGAAFLLLDPAYPPGRLTAILKRARPRAWIRLRPARELPEAIGSWLSKARIPRFELPGGKGQVASLEDAPAAVPVAVGPEDLACLAFTSGSTGEPKGILGRHGSLSHFLPFQNERFELGEPDRFGMLSALSHDPLQRDLFTPLTLGATLVIPDPERMLVPGHLAAWLRHEEVSILHLTPAMGQLLTEKSSEQPLEPVGSLRRIFLVGDVLTKRDVARLAELAPAARIVNLYGSTETQRAVAYHLAAQVEGAGTGEALPLGRGMDDVQLLIRNSSGSLAGIGELGEIVVRSPHLARGYLDDEAASRERFLPNPFIEDPPAWDRVYSTGDLGRYLPEGSVVFAGRRDQQLKIRGFRVELGEIESYLLKALWIERAAVVPHEMEDGAHQLVAFVEPRPGSEEAMPEPGLTSGLRHFLEARLPAYMIPTAFVSLERLPLTPNAKLDRQALGQQSILALAEARERASDEWTAPRDLIEWELTRIWEDLLDLSPVGVRDDFFELGGHSLLAVRMLARIERHFGRALPVESLFRGATVEKLASRLREPGSRQQALGSDRVLVDLGGTGLEAFSKRPFFCVHPVGGGVLCYRELARHLAPEQPFYGLQAPGLEDGEAPLPDIDSMADRYLAAVRSVAPRGPYRMGGWSFGAWVALEMGRKLLESGEEVEVLALIDPPEFAEGAAAEDETVILLEALREIFPRATDDFQSLSRENQVDHLVAQMRAAGLVPPDFGTERARRLLSLYTHNMRLGRRHEPRLYPGRAHLFQAADEPRSLAGGAHARWRQIVAGGLEVEIVPGDHRTVVAPPHVEVLAERLGSVLSRDLASQSHRA